ncbi:hypothetical protein OG216_11910 [Streptomycetaceae bacterium NBC_01309]
MPASAVVTGADQGIGRAVVRGLRQRLAPGAVVHEAVADDIRDDAAARALAASAAADGGGGVDIVIVHTAGDVAPGLRMADQVRDYVEANNHGVHRAMTAFAPVLRDGARFVVVSGALGALDHLPQGLRDRFDDPDAGLPHLARVLDAYVAAVENGTAADQGWPAWIEVASRVAQVAAVRAFARTVAVGPRHGVLVNAVAPGPDDPAEDVLHAATLPAAARPAGTRTSHGSLIVGRTPVPFTRTRAAGHSVNSR